MVGTAQLVGLGAVAGMMLCGGFLAGQLEDQGSAGRISLRSMPSTHLADPFAAQGSQMSEGLRRNGSAAEDSRDFNPEIVADQVLDRLKSAIARRQAHPVATLAARDGLDAHRTDASATRAATAQAVMQLTEAFVAGTRHQKVLQALKLLDRADERLHAVELSALAPAAEHLSFHAAAGGAPPGKGKRKSLLTLTVAEQPFGMNIKRGTVRVSEVYPGFPAQKLGVRKGCELREIAGVAVNPGIWIELFRRTPLPFKLVLECGAAASSSDGDQGGLSGAAVQDPRQYRVMVTKKPYGMNIQVNTVPRVVEVLPGYPAEAAGIRRGFVLTEVDEKPVGTDTWFKEYQSRTLPFTLTFDTEVPLQPGNPYFAEGTKADILTADRAALASTANASQALALSAAAGGPLLLPVQEEPVPAEGYEDFRCGVDAKPFGMHLVGPPGRRPRVKMVIPSSAAEKAGVREGDILIEVAGRPVNSMTWFSAIQQSRPPFGLLFRRQVATSPLPAE